MPFNFSSFAVFIGTLYYTADSIIKHFLCKTTLDIKKVTKKRKNYKKTVLFSDETALRLPKRKKYVILSEGDFMIKETTRKTVDIIGTETDFGASKRGVNMGPMAIRYAGLQEGLEQLGFNVVDHGDIVPSQGGAGTEKLRFLEQITDANKKLYNKVSQSLLDSHFPVVLGGDHSISAGSVSAVSRHFGRIGLIWIDAHADWNNESSTVSGNMHGMPFSAVCGFGPDCMADFGDGAVFVDPTKCALVGARDIEPQERERLKKAGVNVFPICDVDKYGIYEVMKKAIEIVCRDTVGMHLSFDVDALSPEEAPGTGTPVSGGLTVREAYLATEMIAETGRLLSMDMVEVNPILDIQNKTGKLASRLILSALGKVVY